MKRILAWILILMLIPGCALAEPESVLRGKTLIVRMSDAWIQEQLKNAGPHTGWFGDEGFRYSLSGGAAKWTASQLGASRGKKGSAYKPEILDREEEMCLQRVDDNWFTIFRLDRDPKGEAVDLNGWLELCRLDYDYTGDRLELKETACTDPQLQLYPGNMDENEPFYTVDYGDLQIELYDVLGCTAAVIIEKNADKDLLQDVQLMLDDDFGPLMNGYMDGKNAVYCCMLSDARVLNLKSGALPGLHRISPAEGADFKNSAFAVAQKGTGKYGIVNPDGEWVIEPKYDYIYRADPDRTHWDSASMLYGGRHFFCQNGSGRNRTITVLREKGLEEIVTLKGENLSGIGPSVFTTYDDQGTNVYSAITGEKLFSTDAKAVETGKSDSAQVLPKFSGYVQGYPDRLVLQKGVFSNPETRARLADCHGNYIGNGVWQAIQPLVWKNDQGFFLTQEYGSGWQLEYATAEFFDLKYSNRDDGNANWRCGLIDQDGKVLADVKYTSVEILPDYSVKLGDGAGNYKTFRLN